MNKKIKEILLGIIFGISCIIPGFSGGTMLVILGIYESITNSLSKLSNNFFKTIKELFFFFLGTLLGTFISSILINTCIKHYPFLTSSFFIGLIIATIPVIINKIKKTKITKLSIITFILIITVLIYLIFNNQMNIKLISFDNYNINTFIYILLISIIASSTMMIPALSGMSVLLIFGLYDEILNAINECVKLNIINQLPILIPFAMGFIIGIILISKIINKIINNNSSLLWLIILSLLLISPIIIYKDTYITNKELFNENIIINIITSILMIIIGYFTISLIQNTKKEQYE